MCQNEPLINKIVEVFVWIALFGLVDQFIAKYFNTFNKKLVAYFVLFIVSFFVYNTLI
jgi:hypothetical protein